MKPYDRLLEHNIKPSMQRIAIMEYLMDNPIHPSADDIYTALSPSMPTLSKTTVYNTLKLFSEQGAALMLTIDEKNTNFDADTSVPVSYTHLRAHETDSYLVCRLLLEKKKTPNENNRHPVSFSMIKYKQIHTHRKHTPSVIPHESMHITASAII